VEATTNDLRSRTKDLLETVNNGEEIIITYHGKPCAKLVPYFETPAQSTADGIFALLSGSVPASAH
jgi:prevent-host-death family protein